MPKQKKGNKAKDRGCNENGVATTSGRISKPVKKEKCKTAYKIYV